MFKISYTINSINKTNTFDGDDPISVLFSDAIQLLTNDQFNKKKNYFSIDGEIVDKNMLIKDRFVPDSRVKLRVETIIPLSFLYYGDVASINAYENIKISDILQTHEEFKEIDSFKFFYGKNKIDIKQTPKQLGIMPDSSIIVVDSSDDDPTIHSQLVEDIDSSSQSFERKIDSQNDKIEAINNFLKTSNSSLLLKTSSLNSSAVNAFETNAQNTSPTNNNSPSKHSSPPILSLKNAIYNELSKIPQSIPQLAQDEIIDASTPQIYTAQIIVKDESGDDNIFEINRTHDASQMAESLISITASDVIDAYSIRCGVEPEALCLFSSKWVSIQKDSLIWKLFLKKRRNKKTENINTDEQEDNLTRITNFVKAHPSLTANFYIRLNKEILSHFDVIIGNIPFSVQEDNIYECFKRYGNITDLVIFRNNKNESRGFARVTFEREIDAIKAVEHGKNLRYNEDQSRPFLHVFRPKLYYAISSKREKKNIFHDRDMNE